MERKVWKTGLMMALLLIAVLMSAVNIQPAKASGTIYIRADGSIDPPTAPIQQEASILSKPPPTEWSKTYGGTADDVIVANSLVQTVDGGYILAGYTYSFSTTYADFWLVKTDSAGNTLWNKTYDKGGSEAATSIIQTNDDGYAIAGLFVFPISSDFWLVKTDRNGTKQWDKTYDGGSWDFVYSLIQTNDGGYAMAGSSQRSGTAFDFWLVKTDSAGNTLWSKTYGGVNYESASALIQVTDGGYALAGVTNSSGAGGNDFWLVRTDSAGNMLCNKTYGGTGDDGYFGVSIIQTIDEGYALAGSTKSFGAGSADFWLIKTIPPIGNLAKESISTNVKCDGYSWNSKYGISFESNTICIEINIQLAGADPGEALKQQWKQGIEGIWSNAYHIVDGIYTYSIQVKVNWVNTNSHHVVTVYSGTGRPNMLNWYTDLSGWGNKYQDEAAAHEAGHMMGVYDEYAEDFTDTNHNGRYDSGEPFTDSYLPLNGRWDCGALNPDTWLMHTGSLMDTLGPTRSWHYKQILEWLKTKSGRDLSLAQSPLPPYPSDNPIPDFNDPPPYYAPPGVGGVVIPVDKLGLLAPYIGLSSTILVATVATAIYIKRVKRKKETQ